MEEGRVLCWMRAVMLCGGGRGFGLRIYISSDETGRELLTLLLRIRIGNLGEYQFSQPSCSPCTSPLDYPALLLGTLVQIAALQ